MPVYTLDATLCREMRSVEAPIATALDGLPLYINRIDDTPAMAVILSGGSDYFVWQSHLLYDTTNLLSPGEVITKIDLKVKNFLITHPTLDLHVMVNPETAFLPPYEYWVTRALKATAKQIGSFSAGGGLSDRTLDNFLPVDNSFINNGITAITLMDDASYNEVEDVNSKWRGSYTTPSDIQLIIKTTDNPTIRVGNVF